MSLSVSLQKLLAVLQLCLAQPELIMVTDNTFLVNKTVAVMLYIYHMIAYLLVVKCQCLLLSGDVELNPGPLDHGRLPW